MPKRVIDFDALWASDKLASCAEWAQSEYAWLYGLADASGSFEMTNLRVIWGRVAAIRRNLTLERLQEIFDEFIARGLLFTWEENQKRYGHWTGSDVPGRLPPPSWRMRLEKLAPPVPREALAAYSARFGGSKEGIVRRASTGASPACGPPAAAKADAETRGLKPELEYVQAQDWGLDLDKDLDLEKEVSSAPPLSSQVSDRPGSQIRADAQMAPERCSAGLQPGMSSLKDANAAFFNAPGSTSLRREAAPVGTRSRRGPGTPALLQGGTLLADENRGFEHAVAEYKLAEFMPEALLEIYEDERGELPAAGALTPERRRRCAHWLAAGFTPEEFGAAVRHAAATPFLAGAGDRGWQASFDWLIANRSNVRKVLEGEYAPRGRARAAKSRAERRGLADLYAGTGPRPADCGVRVNPAALERIRARRARIDESARFASTSAKQAPCTALYGALYGASHGASDAASACDGVPPRAADLIADRAPKPVACDAQPRASPAATK
jgi:hypothetical protein